MDAEKKYKKAVVGGTFDHFHLGHEKLLITALSQSEQLTIGIATDALFAHKAFSQQIESYDVREKCIRDFLAKQQTETKVTVIPISDIYGNTLNESDIESIFVTEENLPNVEKINARRQEKGFSPLETRLVTYVLVDDGQPITSERIRKGEIDRTGIVYQNVFQRLLTLPDDLRPQLQRPIGDVYKNIDEVKDVIMNKMIITVGDIVTQSLNEAKIIPSLSIIDFKTRRHELQMKAFEHAFHVVNEQGTVNPAAVDVFVQAKKNYLETKQQQTIIIDGEEDLLALPAILLAPLGSVVLYGQFDEGVVVNLVTQKVKMNIMDIVKQFTF